VSAPSNRDREILDSAAALVVLGAALGAAAEQERRRRKTLGNRIGRALIGLGRSIASGGWD
jgi:hypothetical protein